MIKPKGKTVVPNLKHLVSKIVSELVSDQSGHYKCGGSLGGWVGGVYAHTRAYFVL